MSITYLERDIKELALVGKLGEFYDFLVFMAARTSMELKYSEIANASVYRHLRQKSGCLF
ncbi:hypothetical protein [Parablautia muri]|uniref:hypothetical protein n=1 Tax=Parablautia muri TaxID=2320879 RepID=UPI00136EEC0B|nr:hypothetical protein [Parablautia muri]